MELFNESIIRKYLYEAIDEVILGKDESFTPYSQTERERNFQGLTQMRNPIYDEYKEWRNKELKKGRKPIELCWSAYIREKNMK